MLCHSSAKMSGSKLIYKCYFGRICIYLWQISSSITIWLLLHSSPYLIKKKSARHFSRAVSAVRSSLYLLLIHTNSPANSPSNGPCTHAACNPWYIPPPPLAFVTIGSQEEEWTSSHSALRLSLFLEDGGVFFRTLCFYGVFVWHFYRVRIVTRGK